MTQSMTAKEDGEAVQDQPRPADRFEARAVVARPGGWSCSADHLRQEKRQRPQMAK